MKLLMILLTATALQVSASGHAQTVNYGGKDVPLEKIFRVIKKQTGYSVVCSGALLQASKPVSVSANNTPLTTFLQQVLQGQNLEYSIESTTIFISRKVSVSNSPNRIAEPSGQQSIPVSGTIRDENGGALTGVSIALKGNRAKGTTSDNNGQFTIDAAEGDVLVISSVGYLGISVKIAKLGMGAMTAMVTSAEQQPEGSEDSDAEGRRHKSDVVVADGNSQNNTPLSLRFTLAKKNQKLDEVVVKTNYWEVKQKENTGNISRVDTRTIEKQPVVNPLEVLSGRVPGVYISQQTGVPGSPVNIRIRGLNSLRIYEGNTPLYVVDGVPFTFQALSANSITGSVSTQGSSGTASPLNAINPADMESIEILKDADATAIYGSRGANGVILITTKKGKVGKTKVDLNVYTGYTSAARKIKLLNTEQYLEMRREAFANDGISPGTADYDMNGTWDPNRYTDWQEVLIGKTAKTTNTQLSVSGGNANTRYLFSGSYLKQTTNYPGDYDYLRYSSHLALNHLSTDKKFGIDITLSYVTDDNTQPYDPFSRYLYLPPNAPAIYTADGKLNWENSTWNNPMAGLNAYWNSKNNNLIANTVLTYNIVPGLQFKTSVGYNNMLTKEYILVPSAYYPPAYNYTSTHMQVMGRHGNGNRQSWVIEPQLKGTKKIGAGKLEVLIGSTYQKDVREQFQLLGQSYMSDQLINNPMAAAYRTVTVDDQSVYRYVGVYGRLNYNWDGKYIVNATARRDGSSRFGPGNQFANFGAVGAAWIFSNEKFIQQLLPVLSFGKLRASYGTSGNDQIGDYGFLNTYSVSPYNYLGVSGLQPVRLFNENFAWEVNRKFEAGIELGFWQDKLSMAASYYLNRSSNQLIDYTLPSTTGFGGISANLDATVQNTGFELELSSNNINRKDFRWTSAFNVSVPRNKLIAFPNIESSSYANQFFIGRSLFTGIAFEYKGIDPNTGLYQFTDFNGDGIISFTDDRKSFAEITQRYFGGLNNTIAWKGWELDIFFQFVKQDGRAFGGAGMPGSLSNQPTFILDRWQKPGDQAKYQRFSTYGNAAAAQANSYFSYSDGIITDASFIRLKNLALAWKLPANLLKFIGAGRIYLQAQNLLTFTRYDGMDPETGSQLVVPPMRVITAGIQISF